MARKFTYTTDKCKEEGTVLVKWTTWANIDPVVGISLLYNVWEVYLHHRQVQPKWKKEMSKLVVMWTTRANNYWWFTPYMWFAGFHTPYSIVVPSCHEQIQSTCSTSMARKFKGRKDQEVGNVKHPCDVNASITLVWGSSDSSQSLVAYL